LKTKLVRLFLLAAVYAAAASFPAEADALELLDAERDPIPPAQAPWSDFGAHSSSIDGVPHTEIEPVQQRRDLKFFSDEGRVLSPLVADPREAQIRFGFMQETRKGDAFYDQVLGGDLGILHYRPNETDIVSLTARGLMTARFQFWSESFDLLNADFRGGAALGYRSGPDALEAFLYHESSHLGDETIDNDERERIDFSREAFRVLWSHDFSRLRLYAGPSVNLRADPDELARKVTMQAGAELPFALFGRPMYGALDLQAKEEHHWDTNVAAQVGFELGNPSHHWYKRQRVFLEYFQGFSNMGQYFDERERYVLLGIAVDPTPPLKHGLTAASPGDLPRTERSSLQNEVFYFSDQGRAFAPILADPREAQVRMGFMRETREGETLWDLMLGGDLGILHYQPSSTDMLSITVRGLMAPRFDFTSESFDLLNIDYIGGVALGCQSGADSFELFLYHESSHLGDELIDRGDRRRIDYSREAVRLLWAHDFDWLRLYGGPSVNFHANPAAIEEKITLQVGAEHAFEMNGWPLYLALDLQAKEENDWETNVAAQLGLDLGDSANGIYKRQRIFIEYFQGNSNMGQFFDQRERYVLLGFGLFI
jgi:hypothetical protein